MLACSCSCHLHAQPLRAGSNPLESLVHSLLDELGGFNHDRRQSGGWQCEAAAIVAVLAELCFGASPAWEPRTWAGALPLAGRLRGKLPAFVADIQEHLEEGRLWDLQTSNSATGDLEGSIMLKPQALRSICSIK